MRNSYTLRRFARARGAATSRGGVIARAPCVRRSVATFTAFRHNAEEPLSGQLLRPSRQAGRAEAFERRRARACSSPASWKPDFHSCCLPSKSANVYRASPELVHTGGAPLVPRKMILRAFGFMTIQRGARRGQVTDASEDNAARAPLERFHLTIGQSVEAA